MGIKEKILDIYKGYGLPNPIILEAHSPMQAQLLLLMLENAADPMGDELDLEKTFPLLGAGFWSKLKTQKLNIIFDTLSEKTGDVVSAHIQQKLRQNNLRYIQESMELDGYRLMLLGGICVVIYPPLFEKKDDRNRLHCIEGAAMAWGDNYGIYAIDGLILEKWDYDKIMGCQNFKDFMKITNAELRMLALKYKKEGLLTDGMLIDKKGDTELYKISLSEYLPEYRLSDEDAYFLKYKDPSTGRVYVSGIDPKVAKRTKDAEKCRLWKFPLLWDAHNYSNKSDKKINNLIEA